MAKLAYHFNKKKIPAKTAGKYKYYYPCLLKEEADEHYQDNYYIVTEVSEREWESLNRLHARYSKRKNNKVLECLQFGGNKEFWDGFQSKAGYILSQRLPPNVNSPVYFSLSIHLSNVLPLNGFPLYYLPCSLSIFAISSFEKPLSYCSNMNFIIFASSSFITTRFITLLLLPATGSVSIL